MFLACSHTSFTHPAVPTSDLTVAHSDACLSHRSGLESRRSLAYTGPRDGPSDNGLDDRAAAATFGSGAELRGDRWLASKRKNPTGRGTCRPLFRANPA